MGEDGRLFHGTPTVLTNWYGYAAPVYAAANGVVALVRDGAPDRVPLDASGAPIMEAVEAPGNVIVLDLGHGRFATYAHLKAGSVRVAPGDTVVAGQTLAQIGNSGNTKAPHLHFHISGDVEPLAGEGLPFSFGSFLLIGRVSGLAALLNGAQWTPNAAQPSRAVTGEMPLEDMVVRFVREAAGVNAVSVEAGFARLSGISSGARRVEDDLIVLPEPLEEAQRPPLRRDHQRHRQNLGQRSLAIDSAEQPVFERIDGEHEIGERMRPVDQHGDAARRHTFPNAHRPRHGNGNERAPAIAAGS